MESHYIYVMESGAGGKTSTTGRLRQLGLQVLATDNVHTGGEVVSYYLMAECKDLRSALNVQRLLAAADPGGAVVPTGERFNSPSPYPER